MNIYCVYTDGSANPNPGKGGWAYVVGDLSGVVLKIVSGEVNPATNNEMEFLAVLKVLEDNDLIGNKLLIFADSELLVNGINDIFNIKKVPLKNMLERIKSLLSIRPEVTVFKTKGHSGNQLNNLAHKHAKKKATS